MEMAGGRRYHDQGTAGGRKNREKPDGSGKTGTKRSLLVNGQGLPLGIVVSGANTPDGKLLERTLLAIQIERPDPNELEQHLSLDKGYSGEPCTTTAVAQGYTVHVPDKANAKKRRRQPGRRKPRRWIVEVAHSWINRFRRLLIRWEKKAANYLSLLYFACAIICWRKCEV